jgi:hypothetical protein
MMEQSIELLKSLYDSGDLSIDQFDGILRGFAEAKRVKEECTRLLEEAQALMRPQGAWEAHISLIKQSVMEALESVDQEHRAGAQFDNILLAVSARVALAWMDIGDVPQLSI